MCKLGTTSTPFTSSTSMSKSASTMAVTTSSIQTTSTRISTVTTTASTAKAKITTTISTSSTSIKTSTSTQATSTKISTKTSITSTTKTTTKTSLTTLSALVKTSTNTRTTDSISSRISTANLKTSSTATTSRLSSMSTIKGTSTTKTPAFVTSSKQILTSLIKTYTLINSIAETTSTVKTTLTFISTSSVTSTVKTSSTVTCTSSISTGLVKTSTLTSSIWKITSTLITSSLTSTTSIAKATSQATPTTIVLSFSITGIQKTSYETAKIRLNTSTLSSRIATVKLISSMKAQTTVSKFMSAILTTSISTSTRVVANSSGSETSSTNTQISSFTSTLAAPTEDTSVVLPSTLASSSEHNPTSASTKLINESEVMSSIKEATSTSALSAVKSTTISNTEHTSMSEASLIFTSSPSLHKSFFKSTTALETEGSTESDTTGTEAENTTISQFIKTRNVAGSSIQTYSTKFSAETTLSISTKVTSLISTQTSMNKALLQTTSDVNVASNLGSTEITTKKASRSSSVRTLSSEVKALVMSILVTSTIDIETSLTTSIQFAISTKLFHKTAIASSKRSSSLMPSKASTHTLSGTGNFGTRTTLNNSPMSLSREVTTSVTVTPTETWQSHATTLRTQTQSSQTAGFQSIAYKYAPSSDDTYSSDILSLKFVVSSFSASFKTTTLDESVSTANAVSVTIIPLTAASESSMSKANNKQLSKTYSSINSKTPVIPATTIAIRTNPVTVENTPITVKLLSSKLVKSSILVALTTKVPVKETKHDISSKLVKASPSDSMITSTTTSITRQLISKATVDKSHNSIPKTESERHISLKDTIMVYQRPDTLAASHSAIYSSKILSEKSKYRTESEYSANHSSKFQVSSHHKFNFTNALRRLTLTLRNREHSNRQSLVKTLTTKRHISVKEQKVLSGKSKPSDFTQLFETMKGFVSIKQKLSQNTKHQTVIKTVILYTPNGVSTDMRRYHLSYIHRISTLSTQFDVPFSVSLEKVVESALRRNLDHSNNSELLGSSISYLLGSSISYLKSVFVIRHFDGSDEGSNSTFSSKMFHMKAKSYSIHELNSSMSNYSLETNISSAKRNEQRVVKIDKATFSKAIIKAMKSTISVSKHLHTYRAQSLSTKFSLFSSATTKSHLGSIPGENRLITTISSRILEPLKFSESKYKSSTQVKARILTFPKLASSVAIINRHTRINDKCRMKQLKIKSNMSLSNYKITKSSAQAQNIVVTKRTSSKKDKLESSQDMILNNISVISSVIRVILHTAYRSNAKFPLSNTSMTVTKPKADHMQHVDNSSKHRTFSHHSHKSKTPSRTLSFQSKAHDSSMKRNKVILATLQSQPGFKQTVKMSNELTAVDTPISKSLLGSFDSTIVRKAMSRNNGNSPVTSSRIRLSNQTRLSSKSEKKYKHITGRSKALARLTNATRKHKKRLKSSNLYHQSKTNLYAKIASTTSDNIQDMSSKYHDVSNRDSSISNFKKEHVENSTEQILTKQNVLAKKRLNVSNLDTPHNAKHSRLPDNQNTIFCGMSAKQSKSFLDSRIVTRNSINNHSFQMTISKHNFRKSNDHYDFDVSNLPKTSAITNQILWTRASIEAVDEKSTSLPHRLSEEIKTVQLERNTKQHFKLNLGRSSKHKETPNNSGGYDSTYDDSNTATKSSLYDTMKIDHTSPISPTPIISATASTPRISNKYETSGRNNSYPNEELSQESIESTSIAHQFNSENPKSETKSTTQQ